MFCIVNRYIIGEASLMQRPTNGLASKKAFIFVGQIANLEERAIFGSASHKPQWKRHGVLVVEEGRVVALAASLAELDEKIVSRAVVQRLEEGQLIVPAFHDAHLHPHAAGASHLATFIAVKREFIHLFLAHPGQMELQCNLRGLTFAESLRRIEEYVIRNAHLDWIIGSGWDFDWPVHATLLDKIVSDRPAAFRRVDGHAMWVNTRAMLVAQIAEARREMDPAHVDLDEHAQPIGVFHETAADHFRKFFGHLTMEERMEGFRIAEEEMASYGICSFQDALVRPLFLQSYARIHAHGQLRLKASLCLYWDNNAGMEQIEQMIEARRKSAKG